MSEVQQLSVNTPMEKAINIPLILDLICWYATTHRNFHKIRLVNRQFNQIAVSKSNHIFKTLVVIDTRFPLDRFVMLMDRRLQEQITYSCYKIHLLGFASYKIKKFATSIGQFVSVLDLTGPEDGYQSQGPTQIKEQILTILQYIRNIILLKIWTLEEIFLSPTEAEILPQFNNLTQLQVLYGYKYTNYSRWDYIEDDDQITRLGTILISRSPQLTEIQIPMLMAPRARVVRNLPLGLGTERNLKIPHMEALTEMLELPNWGTMPEGSQARSRALWLDDLVLAEEILPIYREVSNLRIRLFKINFRIQYSWNSNFSSFLYGFLAEQFENLKELRIEIDSNSFSGTEFVLNSPFTIPPLPSLKSLNLDFGNSYGQEIFAIHSNFPQLQTLILKGYCDKFGTFKSALFPKLTTLEFYRPIGPFMTPWASIVPNLKMLKLSLTTKEHLTHIESKIYYAIKHFINLTSLELNFDKEADESKIPNIWNVLTGFLPRVTQEILDLNLNADEPSSSRSESLLTNTYSTFSDLKELQELRLTGLGKHNIFAIMYMTKQDLLRAIPSIIIKEYVSEIPEKHLRILRQVHSEVYFSKYIELTPHFT